VLLLRTHGWSKNDAGLDWYLLSIAPDGSNSVVAWFNLVTGTVGTYEENGIGVYANHYMVDMGNGWYRCVVSGFYSC